ncbi:MAG: flagellar biosynthesis protein FlhB [Rubellimicrobium sp.]|nr:flagellar biosynthesis protein FlhB [Rubellimicrobium sp.]
MSGADDGAEDGAGDKSHAPTERRLEDARKKGEIPLSADTTTFAAQGALTLVAIVFGAASLNALGSVLAAFIERADSLSAVLFAGRAAPVLTPAAGGILGAIAPWFLLPPVAAMLALAAQRAPAFAGSKLAFKPSRLSPIANARQKFGARGLVEFIKSLLKLAILGTLLVVYVMAQADRIMASATLAPGVALVELGSILTGFLIRVVLVAAGFALVDLVWQHQSFMSRNRMTRKELLDEMKESEGDPAMRQQRRARATAIAMAPLRKAVAEATVVIVNPTHFAVALAWDPGGRSAPRCVAKGVDDIALRIREFAAEAAIPIRSDPPTARALFAEVRVGEEIDRRHYRAVAAAIRFAEAIRARAAAR